MCFSIVKFVDGLSLMSVVRSIYVINVFTFFIQVTFCYVFNVFLNIFHVFFILKKSCQMQSINM